MNPSEEKKSGRTSDLPLLLSPAGTYECLTAAIQAGADAIYFGVDQLSMRAGSARAFVPDDISEISTQCKSAGVRSFLALNTILYDHDLAYMREIVKKGIEAGIDAFICFDISAIRHVRDSGGAVHISTQCNISNIDAVEFYAAFSEVMVLSRELTLKQVSDIVRQIRRRDIRGPSGELVKIEVFVHGALCMAVSGKCYLSLHSHNASANRGACVQNCRREYRVTDLESGDELDVKGEYIFSSRDLCTIEFLDQLVGSGIGMLKIEGRSRSADYVYKTTRCYREALDSIARGTYTKAKIAAWKKTLATVFNRGFWEGYFMGLPTGAWACVDGSEASERKLYLGKGVKFFSKSQIGQFLIETHELKEQDRILIMGPTTGFMESVVAGLRVEGRETAIAKKGDMVSLKVPGKIRPSDKLYKVIPGKP